MPFPQDLLEQARHLANREPKRPKQASLRRAVSTAYYVLFHLLSMETAKNWKRPAERSTVARTLDHTPMVKVCKNGRTSNADELADKIPQACLVHRKDLRRVHRGAERMYLRRSNLSRQRSRAGARLETSTRRRIFL